MSMRRRSTDIVLGTLFMAGLAVSRSFCFVPSIVGRGGHGTERLSSHPTTQAQFSVSQGWTRTGGSVTMLQGKNHKGRRGPGLTNVQRVVNLREREATSAEPQKVMICNLDYSLDEKDIEEFCSSAGMVVGVKLIRKRNAKTSKGYAFVDYDAAVQATIAIEQLTGVELKGRRVEVKPAVTTQERLKKEKFAVWMDKQGKMEEERRATEDGVALDVEAEVTTEPEPVETAQEVAEAEPVQAAEEATEVVAVEEGAPVS